MEIKIEPNQIRAGLYVTFRANVAIYQLEQREVGLVLIQTHKINTFKNVVKIVPQYLMPWQADFYLVQTPETLILNREEILNKLML